MTKPPASAEPALSRLRLALVAALIVNGGVLALRSGWDAARGVLKGMGSPDLGPHPAWLDHYTAVAVASVFIVVAAARADWVAARRARVDDDVFAALARVCYADKKATTASAFKVLDRDGVNPTRMIVVTSSHQVGGNFPNVRRAAASALGVGVDRVDVAAHRDGVLITVEDDPITDAATSGVIPSTPVPAEPVNARISERVAGIVAGVMGEPTDASVTRLHPNGAPAEVWVDYPSKAASKVGSLLPTFRDVMGRAFPPVNDEWMVTWQSAHDRVVLADCKDPLAPNVPLPPTAEVTDLYQGVVIGINEDGTPWRLPLMGGAQTLIAGATGAGKGSVVWNIIRGVAPMAKAGLVRLWVIDPKGGMELGELEPHVHRWAVTDQEAILLLEDAVGELDSKQARIRASGLGRKVTHPTVEFPLDLVIIDELAALTDNRSPATRSGDPKPTTMSQLTEELTSKIMRQGRAPAFTLVAATQDPRVKVVPNRSAFTQAVALRLSEAAETNMVLGAGMRATGAVADMIPKRYPGVAYTARDGVADAVRSRAAFVDDAEVPRIVALLGRPVLAPQIGEPLGESHQDPLPEPEPEPELPAAVPALRVVPRSRAKPPTVGRARPVRASELPGMVDAADAAEGRVRLLLPDDEDAVVLHEATVETLDGEDVVVLTYVYDGEHQQRVYEFDPDTVVTVLP